MIRFQCSCGKKLGIADTEAGLVVKCPQCGAKLRIPGERKSKNPEAETSPKSSKALKREVAEAETEEIVQPPGGGDLVEVDPVDSPPRKSAKKARKEEAEELEEAEEPTPRPRKKKRRQEEDEDEEIEDDYDEEKGLITPNRIRGVVAVVAAGGVLAFALFFEKFQEQYEMGKWIGCGLAGMMFLAGVFYLVKG